MWTRGGRRSVHRSRVHAYTHPLVLPFAMRTVLLAVALLPLVACAQTTSPTPAVASSSLSTAEAAVRAQIAQDGVHVVHFGAPWCDNSLNELRAGWYEVVDAHPEVSFTFVTIWNDGEIGEDALTRFAIPARVTRLAVDGPRPLREDRRMTFLDLPVSWIPTTWVFNRNGLLATAFNHGEATPAQLNEAIEAAGRIW